MVSPVSKPIQQRPPYWRLTSLLKNLRLSYEERHKGDRSFHILVPDFGIFFRFNPSQQIGDYRDWELVDVDLKLLENNVIEFYDRLMWLLISRGYMAYIRDTHNGNQALFKHILIERGWASRIIDKRLELYAGMPKYKFLIELNTWAKNMPTHYLLTHYPSFFDHLA